MAVGTDILHGAIFKSVGALRHRRLGTVHAQLSGWMFLGSAPMSLLGVLLATQLRHHYGNSAQSAMGYILGGALAVRQLSAWSAKSLLRAKVLGDDDRFSMIWRDRLAALAIGLVGGFIVGLTSVGSGTFFGLTMLFVFPLRAHKVVGTDILHAAGLLWVAGFGHLVAGNVDMHAVGWLLIGSVPGILIGSHYAVRLPEAVLRLTLANVLALSGLKMLNVPNEGLVAGSASPPCSSGRCSSASSAAGWRAGGSARRPRSRAAPSADRTPHRHGRIHSRQPCRACSRPCSSSRCWAGRRPPSRSRRG